MSSGLKKVALLGVAVSAHLFIPAPTTRAVPFTGTAPFFEQSSINNALRADEGGNVAVEQKQSRKPTGLPSPIRFREVSGRGLLVSAWVNGAGPYTFAVDTGAGATILSRPVA